VDDYPLDEIRPLVDQVPRELDGGLVFGAGSREVRVEGESGLVLEVLGLCDGRRSVSEIAAAFGELAFDVRELLSALLDEGVAFDSSQAWQGFHQRVVGAPATLRPSDDERIRCANEERFSHEGGMRAEPLAPSEGRLLELAALRRSSFPGEGRHAVTFAELSLVLRAMYGRGASRARRSVGSGGALYPLVLHALAPSAVTPLEPGLWWYDPASERVQQVTGDPPPPSELLVRERISDGLLEGGQPVVFVSADVGRTSARYSNRAYPLALMEAGAAMQNAYLAGAELGLPVRAIAGLDDAATQRALQLPDGVVPLLALLLGS
jgi:SagB-type dehydrogenase family enzyme